MITDRAFAEGMAALSVAFNRPATKEVLTVYHGTLSPILNDDQWTFSWRRCIETDQFFPPPSVLLRYGQPLAPESTRAVAAYLALVDSYERGMEMDGRQVKAAFGSAGLDAFMASGGTRAFCWCEQRNEPFRRKAFVEAWVETTAQDPGLGKLPPVIAQALEFDAAREQQRRLTR